MTSKDYYFLRGNYLHKDEDNVLITPDSENQKAGDNPLLVKSGGHPSILGHQEIKNYIVKYLDSH